MQARIKIVKKNKLGFKIFVLKHWIHNLTLKSINSLKITSWAKTRFFGKIFVIVSQLKHLTPITLVLRFKMWSTIYYLQNWLKNNRSLIYINMWHTLELDKMSMNYFPKNSAFVYIFLLWISTLKDLLW